MNEETEKLVRFLTGQASIEEFPEQQRAFVWKMGVETAKIISEPLFNENKEIERKER